MLIEICGFDESNPYKSSPLSYDYIMEKYFTLTLTLSPQGREEY
jgi:hypothetical protein